jgi:acyl-CoA thioester hydrolase
MMIKPYFREEPGQPPPLRALCHRRVRFEEVDPLGIVWHGRYPSYFEDARVELGQKYGIGYMDFFKHRVVAPIKKLHVDYHLPLRYPEEISLEAILHWSEAARMDFEFIIRNSAGTVATTGYTVQMMVDFEENLLIVQPSFYVEFCKRWKAGDLT